MLKKVLVVAALASLAGVANAADNGVYLNGQLGYGNSHYSTSDISSDFVNSSGVDKTGMAGRLAIGYQFTQNFAAELGYSKFSNVKFKDISALGYNLGKGTIKQYAIDLVAKGIMPISNGFGVFGTLGGAYLNGSGHDALSGSNSNFWPTFGLGVSYDITNSLPVTASWQRIQKIGSNSDLKSTDFFALGLEYHFG